MNSDFKGLRKENEIEIISEQGAEENVCAQENGCRQVNRRLENIACYMEFVQNIIMPSTTIEYEDEAYK
jgi:hypothetical protein